jgi:hypothetical protein
MSKKPWDVFDPSPMGDIDEKAIFDAVGRALTSWETVEVECAKLFAVLVSSRHKRTYNDPAVRAYGSIVGTHSRFNMLQLAAESYFSKRPAKQASFEKRFTTLIGEYKEYSNRRNEIAHGFVKRVFIRGSGKRPRLVGMYLLPSFFNPRKFKKGELTYSYVSGDIIFYKQEFDKLQLRLEGLIQALS